MNSSVNNPRSLNYKEEARKVARGIRRRALEYAIRNNGGYLNQAFSSAEIFASLFVKILNFDEPFSDRFIVSPRGYSIACYFALTETGKLTQPVINNSGKDIEEEINNTGYLYGLKPDDPIPGLGLSRACGIASARKLKGGKGKVVLFMSDDEFRSGAVWEALQVLSYHKIDNLIVYVNMTGFHMSGNSGDKPGFEPLETMLSDSGAQVYRIYGHNIRIILESAELKPEGKPVFIIADTDPCHGLEEMRSKYPDFNYFKFKNDEEIDLYRELLKNFL